VDGGTVEGLIGANLGTLGLGVTASTGREAAVDAEGRFRLGDLKPRDDLLLRARGTDFALTELGPFIVVAGETRDVGDLVVSPGMTVTGSVVDPGFRPVEGALVELYEGLAMLRDGAQPALTQRTGPDGLYRFPHVRPAPFLVVAQAEGFARAMEKGEPEPGSEPTEMLVTVRLREVEPLRGLVLGLPDDRPLAGARVVVHPLDPGNAGGQATTDDDGRFVVPDIAAGNYSVSVSAGGHLPANDRTWADSGLSELVFRLEVAGSIAGVVIGSDGQPVSHFDLQPLHHRRRLDTPKPRIERRRIIARDGSFSVDGLLPGFWCFEVWAKGHALTISECVRVKKGENVQGVTIRLVRGATLTAVVQDDLGRPVPGARVSLHSNLEPDVEFMRDTDLPAWMGSGTLTDEEGRFTLDELVAITYQVQVDHPDHAVVRRNHVTAVAGETTELAPFVLERSASVSGQAVDSSGVAQAGATVTLYRIGSTSRNTTTDGQGRFRFDRLPKGDYQLTCLGKGANLFSALSALEEGAAPEVFRLDPGQELERSVVARP
jgi:protocatechuate 3,4-dioxygenase beta subunit